MRLLTLFKKSMIENFRDWKILILTLSFAPFFVVLMYFYMQSYVKTFTVAVINHDRGATAADGTSFFAAESLLMEMEKATYPDGQKLMKVKREYSLTGAKSRVAEKAVDLVVEIPEDFSKTLMAYKKGGQPPAAKVKSYGDRGNVRYIMAAACCDYLTYQYASLVSGQKGPLDLQPETIGGAKALNDFELYVPALLGLGLMMLMFTASASIIREKDKGTIIRLQLSNMRVSEFLASISLTQIIIGLLALGLTYLTALGMGYKPSGSLVAVMVVGLLSSLAIIAISFLVAAFLRTIFDLLTIGCFPFFILMFFSGGMFPLPAIAIFSIGGRPIHVNDILPTTHSITAMNKILNFGAGLGNVTYEMAAIVILTVLYFGTGMWLFARRHLRPQ